MLKKTLIAFAALAAVGAATAQSTATVSGTIAAGYLKAIDGTKGFVLDSNSIKVSLSEDLGGGLKLTAATQITGNSMRGGNVTKEDSSIALMGSFGTLSYANTRSGTWAQSYGLVGDNWLWDGSNTSNGGGVFSRAPIDLITYMTPNMSGFTGVVQYLESSTDGSATPAAKSNVVGVRYAMGPLSAGVRTVGSTGAAFEGKTKRSYDGGVNYNFGVAKVGVGFDSKRRGRTDSDKTAVTVGVSAPLGPVALGLNYGKRDVSNFMELGANYSLSKRSSVYLSYGKAKLADSSTNSQYNLVLVHNF
jgi:predicted porin